MTMHLELEAIVARINTATGSPSEPYTKTADGHYKANVGNYHLSSAYGGYALHKMANEDGGVHDIFGGHMPKSVLAHLMRAYLAGITSQR